MPDTYIPAVVASVVPQDGKLRLEIQDAGKAKVIVLMTVEMFSAIAQQGCAVIAQMPLPAKGAQ